MRSVIYLLGKKVDIDYAALGAAQRSALDHQLPLAVVYCYQLGKRRLADLQPLEDELAGFDIPLMTLIGRAEDVLPGFYRHVQPLEVITTGSGMTRADMVRHPYAWPGVVIPIKELQNIVDNNNFTC